MGIEGRTRLQEDTKTKSTSRYRMVTDALRQEVAEGRLAAGVRLPPLHEMAERFNVSTHTVRSAIRILEREGCLYTVPAVGAFVSPKSGGGSAVPKQTTIGLITVDVGGALEMSIARGVERACQRHGWGLQIYDSHGKAETEAINLRRIAGGATGTHGVIVLSTGSEDNIEHLFKLKLDGFPMVLIDRAIPGLKVDLVESDHERGAYLATEHLIQRGHRRVLFLSEPAGVSSIADRIRGYERALRDHDLPVRPEYHLWVDPEVSAKGIREERRWLGGFVAAREHLAGLQPPLGIFALNDYIAWGLVKACNEMGLRIPQDVSIVCFDDSDITRAISPPLTVVAQRTCEVGEKAVKTLENRLLGRRTDESPQHLLIDVELIERESVASPTVEPKA